MQHSELDPFGDVEPHAIDADSFLIEASDSSDAGSVLWHVDAVTGLTTEFMRWVEHRAQTEVLLHGGETRLTLPISFVDLHSTVMDDVLYIGIQQHGSVEPPPLDDVRLLAADLADPSRIDRTWNTRDLLPEVAEQVDSRLWVQHLREVDGELLIHAIYQGPAWDGTDASVDWRTYRFLFYRYANAVSWTLDLSAPDLDTRPRLVHRHADVRAALLSESAFEIDTPQLRLFRTQGSALDIVPDTSDRLIPCAVLDERSPTVLYSSHDPDGPDDYGADLVISHRGRDVL